MTAVLDRRPVLRVFPRAGKHWNTCRICGKSWSSQVISTDCGAIDPKHLKARGK